MNIILHMGDPYPNESPAAKRIRAFYDVLTRQGHHVMVMAPKYGGEQPIPNVVYCPTIEMKKKTTLMRMVNQMSFAVSSVFCSGKAGKADVVLTTSPPVLISQAGWLIAKMKGAKLVYDVRRKSCTFLACSVNINHFNSLVNYRRLKLAYIQIIYPVVLGCCP